MSVAYIVNGLLGILVWLSIPWFSFIRCQAHFSNHFFCTTPGSFWFLSLSVTHRNQLLADLSTAKSAVQGGVVQRTIEKQALAWDRYELYLLSIGIKDGEKQQVAVTGSILRQFHRSSISPMDLALCELFIGAFFFAMRSCEYLKVSGKEKLNY